MRRRFHLALGLLWLAGSLHAGQIVDRIVATVNGTPVFQSDWEVALRCEALLDGKNPESFTPAEQQSVFDRLVDQELIHEQMRGYSIAPISDADVKARVKQVRDQIQGAKTDDGWKKLLAQAGVSEAELDRRIRTQLEVLRFLDARFRPTVRIEFGAVQQYYREKFLPELQKRGARQIPLSEVAEKIREILMQQRMDQQITAWLKSLREQAEIRIPAAKDSIEEAGGQ